MPVPPLPPDPPLDPVTQLDEVTTRVRAPNPSPMTLEGTNTYLLGAPGSGELALVDPGPEVAEHRQALEAVVAARDAEVAVVVLTHHHADHAEAAGWAAAWGARLLCHSPALVRSTAGGAGLAGVPIETVADGDGVVCGGLSLQVLHTPGHTSDHLCLRVRDTGVVLTGDHVLGRGTTVVAWPDGDMAAYVASLRRLAALPATALHPGHGPVLRDPAATLHAYLDHRAERERQILDALAAGDRTPAAVVARVYANVDPVLHPAAERTVRASLRKLVDEGRVRIGAPAGPEDDEELHRV